MNPMLVTIAPYAPPAKTPDEILANWHDGKDFKIYQGSYTSIRDSLKMRMSGFTHVKVIYQNADGKIVDHNIELK